MSKGKLAGIIIACTIAIIVAVVLFISKPWEGTSLAERYTLTTVVSPSGAGYISPSGGKYESGVQVTLTASSASGHVFDYWSGGASGSGPTITVTMDSDKSLTANFKPSTTQTYSLSTNTSPSGAGSISPSSGEYESGAQITLIANPATGYRFVNWTGDMNTITDVNAASTTMTINDNYSITANFEVIPAGQYSLTISSSIGGSVIIPGEGTFIREAGMMVTLVAVPDTGYQFGKWTGNVSTIANIHAASTTITMNENYSVTANFEADHLPVEPAEFVVSNLIVSPPRVEPNEPVTVTATIQNIGGEQGTINLELALDGQLEQSKNVTLDGGETTSTFFYVEKEIEAIYTVELSGLTGAFEVRHEPSASDLVIVWKERHDGKMSSACDPVTWISGVIENTFVRPLTPIIQIRYYNDEGILVYESHSLFNSSPPIIEPGGRFPFMTSPVWRYEGVDIASYDINISVGEVSGWEHIDDVVKAEDYGEEKYLGSEDSEPCVSWVYLVNFKIRNESSEIADHIWSGVIYYNEDGDEVGASIHDDGSDLPPTATTEVWGFHSLGYNDLSMRPAYYEIFISAWSLS